MAATSTTRKDYISREEFEVFEKNVEQGFSRVTAQLDRMATKLDQTTSTDWKTLGMFAGLILSIGALAASPFMRDLERLEDRQDGIAAVQVRVSGDRYTEDDALNETRRLEGKIQDAEAHSDQNREQLDEHLQREMRLLDDALQREMRMLLDAPLERLKAVEDVVRRNSEAITNHQADGHPHAVLDQVGVARGEIARLRLELDAVAERSGQNAIAIAERQRVVEKVDALERTVKEISSEQRRRTVRVYDDE